VGVVIDRSIERSPEPSGSAALTRLPVTGVLLRYAAEPHRCRDEPIGLHALENSGRPNDRYKTSLTRRAFPRMFASNR